MRCISSLDNPWPIHESNLGRGIENAILATAKTEHTEIQTMHNSAKDIQVKHLK